MLPFLRRPARRGRVIAGARRVVDEARPSVRSARGYAARRLRRRHGDAAAPSYRHRRAFLLRTDEFFYSSQRSIFVCEDGYKAVTRYKVVARSEEEGPVLASPASGSRAVRFGSGIRFVFGSVPWEQESEAKELIAVLYRPGPREANGANRGRSQRALAARFASVHARDAGVHGWRRRGRKHKPPASSSTMDFSSAPGEGHPVPRASSFGARWRVERGNPFAGRLYALCAAFLAPRRSRYCEREKWAMSDRLTTPTIAPFSVTGTFFRWFSPSTRQTSRISS